MEHFLIFCLILVSANCISFYFNFS